MMKACVMAPHVRHSERGSAISDCIVKYYQSFCFGDNLNMYNGKTIAVLLLVFQVAGHS